MPVFTPEYLHKVAYNIYIAKGTPAEEAEVRRIKREKLAKKDQILFISQTLA